MESGNRRVYEMHGADLGYRYVSSVISDEEGPAPESPIDAFVPTTWPGAHLPHTWLSPGEAIYDRLRSDRYTLLDLAPNETDSAPLTAAFSAIGAPLDVMKVQNPKIRSVYGRNYILVRPDLHIVWRGDELPAHAEALASLATGHAPAHGVKAR